MRLFPNQSTGKAWDLNVIIIYTLLAFLFRKAKAAGFALPFSLIFVAGNAEKLRGSIR